MRWLAIAAPLALLLGCSTPTAQLRKELGPRVSEEFNCPEDQLVIKETDRLISTTRVLVRGCGKSASFALVEGRWSKVREVNQP
jgi:hypothetical protein